jgi:hypothetical protein
MGFNLPFKGLNSSGILGLGDWQTKTFRKYQIALNITVKQSWISKRLYLPDY